MKQKAVTLNKFFGEIGEGKTVAPFNDEEFDVIVFDEIYFASLRMLAKIKHYSETHTNKIIIATGDTCQ